jgi:hypothetical protein
VHALLLGVEGSMAVFFHFSSSNYSQIIQENLMNAFPDCLD